MLRLNSLVLATIILMAKATVYATDPGNLKTAGPFLETIILPPNDTTSTLLFWAESQNTTAQLKISAQLFYDVEIDVTQTHIWHIAYLYQPTDLRKTASFVAPSCNKYMYFEEHRVTNITLSSDEEVFWMFCASIYSCKLQPPPNVTTPNSEVVQTQGYLLEMLIGVSVLSAFLIFVILILVIFFLRKFKAESHYEKAFWPPSIPPPLPEDLRNSIEYVTKTEAVDNPALDQDFPESQPETPISKKTWNDVTTDPRASILDYESINSVYGLTVS